MTYSTEKSSDGTIKIIFEKGHHCVIIPQKRGYTLCVSSQVGCALGCKFCYTAKMGFLANLTADEIVNQYEIAKEVLENQKDKDDNKNIRGFVFMGMGEPFMNSKAVYKACDILNQKFNFSYKRITISTSGLIKKMNEFIEFKKPMKLALSLHSPDSNIRKDIMPIAQHNSFDELIKTCNKYNETYKDPIMIEYLLIKGLTDSEEDLNKLLESNLSKGTYINLIPLNGEMELNNKIYIGPKLSEVVKWKEKIMNSGYKCFIRSTMGDDIDAACGMLKT